MSSFSGATVVPRLPVVLSLRTYLCPLYLPHTARAPLNRMAKAQANKSAQLTVGSHAVLSKLMFFFLIFNDSGVFARANRGSPLT